MTTASASRGLCRHDGHTISAHIQVPTRPEIGDCPGFDGVPQLETTRKCEACFLPAHERASECRFYDLTARGRLTGQWRRFVTAGGGYGAAINSIGNDLIENCGPDALTRYSRPGTGMHTILSDAKRAQSVDVGHNPDWCNSCPDAATAN